MASPTVLSVGSVTITANGGQTGDLLAQIIAASAGATQVTVTAADTSIPAAPASGGPFELVIEAGYTGPLSIPPSVSGTSLGYAFVINGASTDTNPMTGGDATTAIVGGTGSLNYTGNAGTVVGAGGSGTVNDTGDGAALAFFGNYSVTAGGNNDTIGVDNGSNATISANGSNETIDLGGGASSASAGPSTLAVGALAAAISTIEIGASSTSDVVNAAAGSNNLFFVGAGVTINETGGSSTVITGAGGVVTLNATGGSALVFDHDGGNVINASTSTEFVTAVSVPASTYNAATGGADTIFASSAIDYSNALGTANSLFFLGGAGAVTVSAAAAETVFGGSGGGSYSIGATSFDFFGGGGADTLTGGAGSSSVLAFGAANESLTINQSDSTTSNILVSFGNNDSIDASGAAGGNNWQVVNQTLPASAGGTFTGNSTLVGSNAGGDVFTVYVDNSAPPAHTVVISNWQASDALFISNLGNADQSLNSADLGAVDAFEGGGSSSLTLSDGTTIDFSGNKPTTIAHV